MKIILECMFTGRRIEVKNAYFITSDDFGVKISTDQNGSKDMTYYKGYFIISVQKEGI